MRLNFKIITILLFFLTMMAQAQVIHKYGIKYGINYSHVENESTNWVFNSQYTKNRIGSSIGIFLTMFNSTFFNTELEMNYQQEGAEDKIEVSTVEQPEGTGEYLIWDHEYDFINAGLSIHPKFENNNIALYGIFGFGIKYLVRTRDEMASYYGPSLWNYDFFIGAGLNPKNLLGGKLFAELKWNDSLNYLLDKEDKKLKLSSVQFNLGAYIN